MAKLRELLGWRLYLLRDRLERDCPACLGRGVAPDDRICPACNGRGWQQWRFGWKPVKERGKGMDDQVANWRAQVEAMHAELDALAIPRVVAEDDPRILSLSERFRVFFRIAIFGIPDGLMETYLKERPSLENR